MALARAALGAPLALLTALLAGLLIVLPGMQPLVFLLRVPAGNPGDLITSTAA